MYMCMYVWCVTTSILIHEMFCSSTSLVLKHDITTTPPYVCTCILCLHINNFDHANVNCATGLVEEVRQKFTSLV